MMATLITRIYENLDLQGATRVARDVVRTDGVRGLYRGFGTVIIGIVPARAVQTSFARQILRILIHYCKRALAHKKGSIAGALRS